MSAKVDHFAARRAWRRRAARCGALAMLAGGGAWLGAKPAVGQSSSLFGRPTERQSLTLAAHSPYYNPPEPPREIQKHDLITVVVQETSEYISEGEVDRRKVANVNARLQSWIKLDGFGITPAAQANGDPSVEGQVNSQYRAQSEVETRGAMRFRIAASVVDVRPNGVLVIEAHRTIENNEEAWEYSLSGLVRREDVLPNNTVLSEDVAEVMIRKRDVGHVRDGYRRGWFLTWLDKVAPF